MVPIADRAQIVDEDGFEVLLILCDHRPPTSFLSHHHPNRLTPRGVSTASGCTNAVVGRSDAPC
jgi:hypothetical protein